MKYLPLAILMQLSWAILGCAPNNYSFANSHSLQLQSNLIERSFGGIGFDGPERITYYKHHKDSFYYSPDNNGSEEYEQKVGTGFGPYIHGILPIAETNNNSYIRFMLPLHIGQIPTFAISYAKNDFAIHGIVRFAILQNGIGAGLTYNPVSSFVIGIGSEYRQEFYRTPKARELIYDGLFEADPAFMFRPTAQADYSFTIPNTRIVPSFGCVVGLNHSYDIQASLSLNIL
jgi:hypothetical protein